MGIKKHLHKSIATALLLTVGFSGPLWADETRLDTLFEQLQSADADDVGRLQGQIANELGKSGSAAMDLLYRRGVDAIEEEAFAVAVEHLTALVDHAPAFAEGYHARATAYYNLGLYGPALDDLRQTLVLEPRHFGAMLGLAAILEELERPEDALETYERVRMLMPADPEIAQLIERVTSQISGETL